MKKLIKTLFCIISLTYSVFAYSKVSLNQKIGQMIMIGFHGQTINKQDIIAQDILKQRIGGVVLFAYNIKNPKQLKHLTNQIQKLLIHQKLAVLSTHQSGQPYASLVAFVSKEDLKTIFFITPRSTQKFAHLSADSRVAILINSSLNII